MDEIRSMFDAIMERLDIQGAHIECMKMDIAKIQGDIKELKQDVTVLKQDVSVLKQDVAVLKQDVAVLKQDVSSLKEGQTRQDRILKTLMLRSIEQESDLLELKHIK
jgi:chromosome segregation ATPase